MLVVSTRKNNISKKQKNNEKMKTLNLKKKMSYYGSDSLTFGIVQHT